jgi:hypothetical protein
MDRHDRRPGSDPERRTVPDAPGPGPDPGQPTVYRVRVRGHLDDWWADRGEGLSVTRDGSGDTVLTVLVVDQAALHGMLRKLRDVGVPLVSINPAGPEQTDDPSKEDDR